VTDALAQVKTYAYAKDDRLTGITYTGAVNPPNVGFTTTPENFITGITESSDAASVYPASGSQTATYNTLNQLTDLSGQALTYDANGNLTADGQRTYAWDAENRLVGIGYPGTPGKATAFTYDGLDRRATISSTPPGGGSATVTSYLWCGDDICQARNAGNTTLRSYYDEGEYLPGTPAQTLYYGIDQIGSVRRVFASTSSATAYGYDPYSLPLQATAPTTDFVYGGMFYNAGSGLYLTKYRAFDPIAGRWLSRDPTAEISDPVGNLYAYVGGDPITRNDPRGDFWPVIFIGAGAIAGILTAKPANAPGEGDPIYEADELEPYENAAAAGARGICKMIKKGEEISFGKNFRVAPFGNQTTPPHRIGKYPHYHRRVIDPKTGQTKPGQGIGRHRPWETKQIQPPEATGNLLGSLLMKAGYRKQSMLQLQNESFNLKPMDP
jgi:RHS repeat-associated protein